MPFKNVGLQAGIEIWRIEKMEPASVNPKDYGTFFSGDCYIVLKTEQKATSKEYDLFYWLGKDSSQDEQGAVAYHTVNLDDALGGKPVQYREVHGYESPKFMAAFPKGIVYKEGGVASAFKHIEKDKYEPRLFHLKGKRNVRVQQVPLSADSLNDGDVFILDLGLHLFLWNGKSANKYEKAKGAEVIRKIKDDERGGRAEITVFDSGHETTEFWSALGGKKPVKSAEAAGSDDDAKQTRKLELFRVSETGGSMHVDKVAEDKLEKAMLTTNDVFILLTGSEVFVWVGKGASKAVRSKGMEYGTKFLKERNLPAHTPITRVAESGETPAFKAQFVSFDAVRTLRFDEAKSPRAAAPEKSDTTELYKRRAREEEKMVQTEGKITIWRIENMQKAPLPADQYGQFFMGDSYIVQFTYQVNKKDKHLIYFWQGRDSSNDEKGASALLVKKMDDDLKGEATQVRVVQNKEPNHFLALFKGKMVVHSGGHASAFKNRKDTDSYDTDGVALYHVRGTTEFNTRAVQVPERASSLNSGDCFVLLTEGNMYVWYGKGSTNDEKKTAANIAKNLQHKRQIHDVNEGSEPAEFWTALGGTGEYPKTKTLEGGAHDPRLFQCNDRQGNLRVEEIFDFTQDDLIQEDVMLLDTYDEVFVWIGHESTKNERDGAMKAALEYVKNAPDGRSADTPVFRVAAGSEPPNFTCHFLGWNDSKAMDFTDPYLKKLGQLQGKTEHKGAAMERVTDSDIGFKKGTFTYDELVKGVEGIDLGKKEEYLSEQEFHKVFGVSKADFHKMPAWKQKDEKKKHNLF